MSATEGLFPNNQLFLGTLFSHALIILSKWFLEVLTALGALPYKFDNPEFLGIKEDNKLKKIDVPVTELAVY